MIPRPPAYTLVELLAVTVLMAVVAGLATLGMPAVSEAEQLRSAADQLAALFRVAQVHALTSGRPVVLECVPEGCRVRRPRFEDGQWRWSAGPLTGLPSRVRIAKVGATDGPAGAGPHEPAWTIPVVPGDWTGTCAFELSVAGRRRVRATLGLLVGAAELHWLDGEPE